MSPLSEEETGTTLAGSSNEFSSPGAVPARTITCALEATPRTPAIWMAVVSDAAAEWMFGAWQAQTRFQQTMGITPSPGIAIVVNLATLQPFKQDFNQ